MSSPSPSTLALLLGCALALALPSASARAEAPAFRVVVNAQNPAASVTRQFLSDAFLKKTARWSDGEGLRPVDQRPDAAPRKRFSESVLKRSVAAIRSYWAQRIFSGRDVPPPELDSDEAVLSFVLKNRGAVGYVSADAKVEKAKILLIE